MNEWDALGDILSKNGFKNEYCKYFFCKKKLKA